MTPEQEELIQALYQEHRADMLLVAARIAGESAAPDIVSQAFLAAILKIDTLSECGDPSRWLFHVLKNLSIDEYRRVRLHPAVSLESLPEAAAAAEISFQSLLPEGLSAEERQILTLRVEQEMDYAVIAEVLGSTPGACRMRFTRAKRRCAELLRRQKGG